MSTHKHTHTRRESHAWVFWCRTPLDKHCLCQDYEYKEIEKTFRNHRKTILLVFELQCYSDVYNYCWVGELQEICQGRETRGGHQQDREKKTENAFICRLGWLTWLENNNRSPFSLTSPLPWFIGYNIIDSHWRWIWNMYFACCYCLCLHSTFTARGVLFLVYSLPCCKPLLLFQLPPVLFFLPHPSCREVKKGGTVLSWGSWQARGLAGYDILLDAGNCLLIFACGPLSESGVCVPSLLCFCLYGELKFTGSKRRNSHTWHRALNRRS